MNNFIFFGTDNFSIEVLKVLLENNIRPNFVITQPDRPKGRNLVLTPPEIKVFCEKENIKVLQPEKLSSSVIPTPTSVIPTPTSVIPAPTSVIPTPTSVIPAKAGIQAFDFFIVASFGKIIPQEILDIPKLGSLNVHPSLLPKYRGASPIETVILEDNKNTGVTIILMDEKMDHGPILLQKEIDFREWKSKKEVRDLLAKTGGNMLVEILPEFLSKKGKVKSEKQKHEEATFTKMIKKSDGEIHETDFELKKYLKFIAYTPWPGAFFFVNKNGKNIRVKITDAIFENDHFVIKKVIPEGKSEMTFESFENGYLK